MKIKLKKNHVRQADRKFAKIKKIILKIKKDQFLKNLQELTVIRGNPEKSQRIGLVKLD